MFTVVCRGCLRAFKAGAQVDVVKCEGCPWFEGVRMAEDAWLEAQHDVEEGPNDHQWAEFETWRDEYRAEQEAQQDEQRPTGQASPEREPLRQRVNGWPGAKARKVRK